MRWKLGFLTLALAMIAALPLIAQELDDFDEPAPMEDEFLWVQADDDDDDDADSPRARFKEQLALSKEQEKKMKDLRLTHQKEMIPLRADLRVKEIEFEELFTGDVSQSAVNSKIDEIAKIKVDIAKRQAAHRIAMRQILTKEQREIWDNRPHRGMGMGMGMRGMHEKAMMERHMQRQMKMDRPMAPRGRGRGL